MLRVLRIWMLCLLGFIFCHPKRLAAQLVVYCLPFLHKKFKFNEEIICKIQYLILNIFFGQILNILFQYLILNIIQNTKLLL